MQNAGPLCLGARSHGAAVWGRMTMPVSGDRTGPIRQTRCAPERDRWSTAAASLINSGGTMDNNKWERRLDDYLDFLEGPLAAIPEIKQKWGTIASVVATPFATLFFILKALITSPWGLFLVLARFLER